MTARPKRKPARLSRAEADRLNAGLLRSAYDLDTAAAAAALADGADVDTAHERTGLTALHIAAGTNNIALARILIDQWNASFGPDRFGRWPTTIAAECGAGDELCDYIVEREAAWLERTEADKPSGKGRK